MERKQDGMKDVLHVGSTEIIHYHTYDFDKKRVEQCSGPFTEGKALYLCQMSPVHAVPSCPRSCSCSGVKEVHCTFRHLTTIPKTFPKDTERLNLGPLNGILPSPSYPTWNIPPVQILKLSYNKLTSVNPGLFEGLVSLIRLHLDHNLINFIEPYSFSGLTSLKLLQLEGNLLKDIHPHTFITVSVLGSFWTSGLKHLHLSDNLLEQLPAAVLNTAPRLELLSLYGNPWTCDCQLHWLIEWSATHEELKGYLVGEPSWLLQPRITLRLNRRQTTTKKLVMDFTTVISKHINSHRRQEDDNDLAPSWALILRGTAGQVQTALEGSVQTALEGSKVNLECSVVTSDREVKVEWMFPDLSIVEDATDKIHISETGALIIMNATRSDSGLYHCMIRTKAGVDLMPLRLTVKEHLLSPTAFNGQKIVVERGRSFSLPCEVTSVQPSQTMWYLPKNQFLLPTQQTRRAEVTGNGTLVVRKLTQEDAGEYSCLASNLYGVDMLSHMVEVTGEKASEKSKVQTEKEQPILPVGAEEEEGSGGDYQEIIRPFATQFPKRAQLDRIAQLGRMVTPKPHTGYHNPPSSITHKPNPPSLHRPYTPRPLSPTASYTYTLQPLKPAKPSSSSFSGPHHPITSGYGGRISSRRPTAAPPFPWVLGAGGSGVKPSITTETTASVSVLAESDVILPCKAVGNPEPNIAWTKVSTGATIPADTKHGPRFEVFKNGTFVIKKVQLQDRGQYLCTAQNRYECLATNTVGIAKRTIHLEVRADPPSFSHQPPPLPIPPTHRQAVPSRQHSVTAMYGSAVYLHCPDSTGSTRGTIWQLPSKAIMEYRYSPERPIKVFRNGTLRILQLTELDGGNYLCVFQRPNGEDMELFQVEVLMTPPRIEHVRTAQTRVTFGENFQVDCVATGLPDPEVSWSLPDGTLINNALQSDDSGLRNRRYVIFGNGTLLLQQMGKKDEGDYTCYAKNKLGKDERKVSVIVGPNAPKIRLKSQSLITVKLGESGKMSCQATGEPTPRIMWISPRKDVIPMSSDKFQIMDNGMLVVKKVTLADEGNYACVAQNSAGDDVKNMKLEVEPQEPFINGIKGQSTTKVLGVSYQTALLDCRVEGKPEPRVWWVTPYGHSLHTPYLGGRFQVHRNGSLEVRGVRKTDEGRYMCMAKNHLGEASLLVELDVASLAEKPSFAVPNIEILPIKQDGGELILECPARGKPNPEFAWVLPNGTMLMPGVRLQRFTHHVGNGTLRISQPVASDKGVYRCLAKNVAGQAEKRYALEAGRKPVIRGSTGGMKITYGHNLNLPCTADGWPPASITWTLPNGVVLDKPQTIGRISFLANGILQLRQVATFDKGTYICKASNSFGLSTLSYPVAVMVFPPHITNTLASITRVNRGSPVTLNCVATGIPKPDISWTLPGRTTLVPHNRFTVQGGIHMTEEGSLVIQNPVLMNSGIYKCNAKNALGTDFKSTYLQVV
ncbi:hypothetical protein PAMP_023013 [Pampus punctatissimus]